MISRRKFIKRTSLSVLGIGLCSSVGKAQSEISHKINKYRPITIKGTVKSENIGIPNVAITDGLTVVKTDSYGNFHLISNSLKDFVYFSIPSGYKIPQNETGTAKFYHKINILEQNKLQVEFELEKTKESEEVHSFFLLADPQTLDTDDLNLMTSEVIPDIQQTVDEVDDSNIFGVSCGDIMYDRLELYPYYERAVNDIGIPFFQVLGNHDVDILAKTDEESSRTYKNHFGPTYYSFNRGRIHYVVLDDVFWHGDGYIGYLDQTQLDWLEADLSIIEKGTTVVLFTHIPVYCEIHRRHGVENPRNTVVITNRKKLYKILNPYKSYVLSGHTHESEYLRDGNSEIHIGGAVCGAWWTGPICRDGTPKGYTLYSVNGNDISWKYKSLGKEFGHQMTLYGKGSMPTHNESIIANIWSADNDWEVVWYQDNEFKGEMKRIVGKDPMAVKLYEGNQLPTKHKWVEPYNTDHLFIADPGKNAKVITVKAMDRWGNVYSDNIKL